MSYTIYEYGLMLTGAGVECLRALLTGEAAYYDSMEQYEPAESDKAYARESLQQIGEMLSRLPDVPDGNAEMFRITDVQREILLTAVDARHHDDADTDDPKNGCAAYLANLLMDEGLQ